MKFNEREALKTDLTSLQEIFHFDKVQHNLSTVHKCLNRSHSSIQDLMRISVTMTNATEHAKRVGVGIESQR